MIDRSRVVSLLQNWTRWADRWWYELPGHTGVGCFGTGYNGWGVQTNQKYVAAQAMLAVEPTLSDNDRAWALQRALAALRFTLRSHVSGDLACTDGTKWGQTWISALGIERMMHGLHAIRDHLSDEDRAGIERMLATECDWLATSYRRGPHEGVQAGKWNDTGKNDPESNLWNGAILWRAATMYGSHASANAWREQSLRFLANGVSIDADATDDTVYDGKPLRDRHVGASFFDHYALDHHGYLNVGYMVICVSNAAILHFDHRLAGLPTPELLHLHQRDLWRVLREMIFDDGRLARIGGDSRVRYAYCQEYLVPSLLYAADQFGEPTAERKLAGILDIGQREADANGDGSFYGKRLTPLSRINPYYYVRIEGDRASALSMALAYAPAVAKQPTPPERSQPTTTIAWGEPEHGAIVHRCPTRFASFSWRAYATGQGLCLPPDASDLAEWEHNLTGAVDFVHHPHPTYQRNASAFRRRLITHHQQPFEGGFITSGIFAEGNSAHLAEGWQASEMGRHYLAFVALPDGHSVVGIQLCRLGAARGMLQSVKGMRLNVPNDVMNGRSRLYRSEHRDFESRFTYSDGFRDSGSAWMCVDERLSAISLTPHVNVGIERIARQQGGSIPNLIVDQIVTQYRSGDVWLADPGSVVLDCAWLVSTIDSDTAKRLASKNAAATLVPDVPHLRVVRVVDVQDHPHTIALNVSDEPQTFAFDGRSRDIPVGGAVIVSDE